MFSKEIQTAGQITMKIGTEVVLKGGKVLGVNLVPPHPLGMGCIKGAWGASRASKTPDLVGVGQLFVLQIQIPKDLGPMSFWSHGHSLWRIA